MATKVRQRNVARLRKLCEEGEAEVKRKREAISDRKNELMSRAGALATRVKGMKR